MDKYPTMMYQQGLQPIVVHSEREFQSRLEVGWTTQPPPPADVPGHIAAKRAVAPPLTSSKYPTMVYHPVFAEKIANSEEEFREYLKKGWSEHPVTTDNKAILEAKIAETEAILEELQEKLQTLRLKNKGSKPVETAPAKVEEVEGEALTAIIGIRVWPSFKKDLQELAAAGGQTLSDLIFNLIDAGLENMPQEDVKQGSEKR